MNRPWFKSAKNDKSEFGHVLRSDNGAGRCLIIDYLRLPAFGLSSISSTQPTIGSQQRKPCEVGVLPG